MSSLRFSSALGALASLLAASGCAQSGKVTSTHIEQPGTHVVATNGTVSIARNTSGVSRVCTRQVAQVTKGLHGKRPMGPPTPQESQLDVLMFRLCEARGNGDITAEQYASAIQVVVKAMEERAARPHPTMPPQRPGRRGRPGWGADTPPGPGGFGNPGGDGPGQRRRPDGVANPWRGPGGPEGPPAPPPKVEPPKK